MKTEEPSTQFLSATAPDVHRVVVEDLTETICRFLPDGTLTYVNEVYCRFFGGTQEELVGTRWQPVAVSADVPMIEAKLRMLTPQMPVVTIENRVYDAQGDMRWMQFVNRGFFDADGNLTEMQSVGREITKRVHVEQQLHESQQRWRFALESSGFGVWDWDRQRDTVFYSRQWKALLGYDEVDVIPSGYEGWQAMLHPDDAPQMLAALQAHMDGRTAQYSEEFRLRCKNGSWKWVLGRGRVIQRDDANKPLRMIGTIADISKRKAAEEREASNLQLIAQGAPCDAVLEAIVRNVEAGHPGVRCSVMLADATGTFLRISVAPSLPDYAKKAVDGLSIHPESLCCGAAVYSATRVVCPDVLKEPRMAPFHELAVKAKLHACWSEPIISSTGKVLGAFASYRSEPHEPDAAEIRTITNAARLAALAIEREWKEQALRISEERYARALRGTTDGLWDLNLVTGDVYLSPRWKQMLGFDENELPHNREASFLSRLHPDDVAKVQAARQEHFEHRGSYQVEFRLLTKSGGYRWFLTRGQADWNEQGDPVRLTGTISDISERKVAEQALEESEQKFRAVFEQAAVGVAVVETATGRYLSVNQRICEINRRTREEMLQLSFKELTCEDDLSRSLDRMEDLKAGRVHSYNLEKRNRLPDGSMIWVNITVSPMWQPGEPPLRHVVVVEDITERKRVEEALKESEQRFRTIFEQAAVGIAVIETPTGRYLDVNQRMCEINHRTREEMLRLTFMDVTYPEDLRDDLNQMEDLKAGRISSFNMEKRNVAPDGTLTWINLTVAPMWRPGEPPSRHIAVVEDITERKRADDNYRRELAYNQALVNNTSTFIVAMDVEGRFVHANAAVFNIMGYTEQEVIGKTPWEIGLLETQEISRSEERFARLLRGEDNPAIDIRLRAKNGEWHTVEVRSTSTRKPDGSTDRIIITGTDVTERNRLQRELLRVIEQEQARVGHDLHDGVGQTMTGMVIMMEALEAELQGEAKAHAQRIHQLMTESVAEVRRMSHGLSPTSVKYRGLEGALNLLAETVRTNFRTPCTCEMDAIICIDNEEKEAHLFRIAQEAVNNALRHGSPEQIRIALRKKDGVCELSVEDDGKGIKKAKKSSSNRAGIGLRVMEYRANLIGGRLKVENKPTHGVIVTCRFECGSKPPAKPKPAARKKRKPSK